MSILRTVIVSSLLLCPLAGCDSEASAEGEAAVAADGEAKVDAEASVDASVEVAVDGKIKAEALDLEAISFMVKKGMVKNAKALEKELNKKGSKLANVDIDGDGKRDRLVIKEVRNGDVVTFEVRVAASGKGKVEVEDTVILATVVFTPDRASKKLHVEASYTTVVIHEETQIYVFDSDIEVNGDVIVVTDMPFVTWVYTVNRPVYVGVVFVDVHHHVKYKRWKKHKKHKKHKKGRGYVKVKHKHRGGGKVKVRF